MTKERTTRAVPCGACKLCCRGEIIVLHPENGDNVADYETVIEPHPLGTGKTIHRLKQTFGGDCIYLGKDGCTIYEKRPVICREFDCRLAAKRFGDLVLAGHSPVLTRGRELLPTLEDA